jgi:hypothetical protein
VTVVRSSAGLKIATSEHLFLFALPLAVLDPNLRLFHVIADKYTKDRRQDAEPKQAPPADRIEEQPVDNAGECESEGKSTLQKVAHEAA